MSLNLKSFIAVAYFIFSGYVTSAAVSQCETIFFDGSFISLAEIQKINGWTRSLKMNSADTLSHEALFSWTEKKLETAGFKTKREIKKFAGQKSGFGVIELVKFPRNNVTATLMARVQKRYGTKFFIDPLLAKFSGDGGYFIAGENVIVLDLQELKNDLNTPPHLLLHEIRHLYFFMSAKAGRFHEFTDAFVALEDRALGTKDFYEDYLSLEELSTYYRNLRISEQRFRGGVISESDLIIDANTLRKVAEMVLRISSRIENNFEYDLLTLDRNGIYGAPTLIYPIFKGTRTNQIGEWYINLLPSDDLELPVSKVVADRLASYRRNATDYLIYAKSIIKKFKK